MSHIPTLSPRPTTTRTPMAHTITRHTITLTTPTMTLTTPTMTMNEQTKEYDT